jgi:hypothetical protein
VKRLDLHRWFWPIAISIALIWTAGIIAMGKGGL